MRSSFWIFLLGLVFLGSLPAGAVRPFQPGDDGLPIRQGLVRNSGYIFSGTVKAVERIAPQRKDSVAVMRITFQVEEPMRGVRKGQLLVIREWAGLWQAGERYRPGERVMLFLYPPSKVGLTSPVGGGAGRFRVDPQGNVIVKPRKADRPGLGEDVGVFPRQKVPPQKLFLLLRDRELE